ncbi:hypothetical protein COOONC_25867 [Cooperia oncophora]
MQYEDFSRRGSPAIITSDNSNNLLAEQMGIDWKTSTPFALWQGAFTITKLIRKRVLKKSDLETVLIEIEGSLNMITYMSRRGIQRNHDSALYRLYTARHSHHIPF